MEIGFIVWEGWNERVGPVGGSFGKGRWWVHGGAEWCVGWMADGVWVSTRGEERLREPGEPHGTMEG